MMKKICFIFLFFLNFHCFAQGALTSFENAKYLNQGESVVVQAGEPVIFTGVEKQVEKFVPQEVTWHPELQKVKIKTFGGDALEVPFVTHIPSFSIFVQVLPDKSVVVTERIAFINREAANDFVRSYPIVFKDIDGSDKFLNRDFIYSKYNMKPINALLQEDEKKDVLSFFDDSGVSSGVHLFEISYLVKDAIQITGNISRLFLPLLGTDNPYLTERLQIFITYPNKSKISMAKAFYGINNQAFDKAGDFYKDENAHLLYKQKGLLPDNTDLKIEVLGDAVGFLPENTTEKIDLGVNHYAWLISTLLGILVIYLYLHFSIGDLQDKFSNEKFLNNVRSRMKFNPVLLRPLIKTKIDARAFLVSILSLMNKRALEISLKDDKITLIKSKKRVKLTRFERRLMRFIFPLFKRTCVINSYLWKKMKIKHFQQILKTEIKKQAFVLMHREAFVSAVLLIISLLFVLYFGASVSQFVLSLVILLFSYCYLLDSFLHRTKLIQEITILFNAYLKCPQRQDRQLLSDVALELGDRSSERTLDISFQQKKIPLSVFEKMFLYQLTILKEGKNEKN